MLEESWTQARQGLKQARQQLREHGEQLDPRLRIVGLTGIQLDLKLFAFRRLQNRFKRSRTFRDLRRLHGVRGSGVGRELQTDVGPLTEAALEPELSAMRFHDGAHDEKTQAAAVPRRSP